MCLLSLILLLVSPCSVRAAEPWADERLSVTDELLLWLDASVQEAAAGAAEESEALIDGRELPVFFDASGSAFDLKQPEDELQPRLRLLESQALVRFDGRDDYLLSEDATRELEDYSVFLFAAPASNLGGFRCLLSARRDGTNDYQTGLNVDMGFGATPRLQVINVEGAGMPGQSNLLESDKFPFHRFHVFELHARGDVVELLVDGQKAGSRDRRTDAPAASLEQIALGCRLIGDDFLRPDNPGPSGHFHGDLAEVLVYSRRLADDESAAIRSYLRAKYEGIDEVLARYPEEGTETLQMVENPPPVQMFVPGFEIDELPVSLSNINNVQYRPDGTLVALAYNGDIHLLRDQDGDGLEETSELFRKNNGELTGPIGMALTPAEYPRGDGLFVTSKGKCSLIVDTDGDDKADEEIIVADGWQQLFHSVDALGVAVDPEDHSVWFGLGTKNFADAYLLGEGNEAKYRLDDERGTILRVAPDLDSREIVCTGIRFPVAMRFNADGELFCTDQEGATWLPNGNPYDELLHIQRGRHYGFPPRHPRWLPDVIDEPSVFDYGPQHQSTCGLNFNEPVIAEGPIFGPEHWQSDAFVTGYSRGKLYRTRLVRTDAGYVAQTQLIGSTSMLPVDACVSPAGEMVLSVHSGGPDWGSGPAGDGKLYKIRYQHRELPIPVLAWPQSRHQVRVAFDRPLTPGQLSGLSEGIDIDYGHWVRAGDRFEAMRPGYAVVQKQMAAPRFDLPVTGVQVTPDWRTLVIDTAAQKTIGHHYAVSIDGLGRDKPEAGTSADAPRRQLPQTDVDYALTGVEATLATGPGEVLWQGWLPHAATDVANKFTAGSSDHDAFREAARRADSLTITTQLDLRRMLQPDVQPGSRLDYEYPSETVTVVLRSPGAALTVEADGARIEQADDDALQATARITVDNHQTEILPLTIRVDRRFGDAALPLQVSWHTARDERERAFPLRRFVLPWVNRSAADEDLEQELAQLPPELEGGSWGRGRKVFFGEQAGCAKCHRIHGEGGNIGPDLSNLRHRDYHSVHRDIVHPSFAINPDHLSYTVVLDDGQVLVGLVRHEDGQMVVGTEKAELHRFDPDRVEEIAPSQVSIMPKGIDRQIGDEAMRDLLTFLIGPPPKMPDDRPGRPEPRSRAEVETVLAGAAEPAGELRPLHIVLVAGAKDHGPGEHDYPAWQRTWAELFRAAENVSVSTAMDFPDTAQLERADALIFYQKGTWNAERAAAIDAFLQRGGGVSYIHYAVDGEGDPQGFAERIGLAWQGGRSKFRHGPLDLIFGPGHPIGRNLTRLHLEDESYWDLAGDRSAPAIIARGEEEGALQPLIWCQEQGGGRVFVSIPGHYSWSFDDPLFRIVLLRGIAWSVEEPVDRFNPLVMLGLNGGSP